MVYYPETAHTSFNDKYKHITWSENQSDFNAWKEDEQDIQLSMLRCMS